MEYLSLCLLTDRVPKISCLTIFEHRKFRHQGPNWPCHDIIIISQFLRTRHELSSNIKLLYLASDLLCSFSIALKNQYFCQEKRLPIDQLAAILSSKILF